MKMMLVVSGFVLVGCGGGGGTSPVETIDGGDTSTSEVYKNKTLPTIDNDTVPDVLLNGTDDAASKLLKFDKSAQEAYGFVALKKNARFFYAMQLEMNMNLSYYDSVWAQIETYCEEKTACNIPDETIEFTYTSALYNHDVELIKAYEEKTGDIDSYGYFIDNGKELVGTKIALSSASLVRDVNAEYENTLTSDILSLDENSSSTIGTSTLKWNKDNSKYLIRDEFYVSEGDNSYIQFTYNDSVENKESEFTTNDYYSYGSTATLRFVEKDGKIEFFENIEYYSGITSYSEGYLEEDGGRMVSFTEPEGYDERFDNEGNILSEIKCFDQIYLDTDYTNLASDMICDIQDTEIVKDIITKNVYSLGSVVFDDDATLTPLSSPNSKSIVKFEDNNTLFAIVDCSTFTADYLIDETGITFSSIIRTASSDLKCVYPGNEDNFESFLNDGYQGGYNTAYDFWPTFDKYGNTSDFNLTKFNETLYSEMFVDSPLMNSVFSIKSGQEYFHVATGKYFTFRTSPIIKVENEKIIIDLLDASFDAEIEVVDATHIKFNNINRINESNVTYPIDENRTCVQGTEEECIDDPYSDSTYGEKIIADIVEAFLNETIEVSLATTEYSFINFIGEGLIFTGSILD